MAPALLFQSCSSLRFCEKQWQILVFYRYPVWRPEWLGARCWRQRQVFPLDILLRSLLFQFSRSPNVFQCASSSSVMLRRSGSRERLIQHIFSSANWCVRLVIYLKMRTFYRSAVAVVSARILLLKLLSESNLLSEDGQSFKPFLHHVHVSYIYFRLTPLNNHDLRWMLDLPVAPRCCCGVWFLKTEACHFVCAFDEEFFLAPFIVC